MLFVYFKAPFGAFKPFQSVELHATADFLTHSAAYGLLLGLAGVDCHADYQRKKDFPDAQIAIGQKHRPLRGRVLQQLHKMHKGTITAEELERAKGNKTKIDVFRREHLCDLEGFIGLRDEKLEARVRKGINEPSTLSYWGLPFMGDNNFFLERIEVCDKPEACQWFYPFTGKRLQRGGRLHFLSIWTDYETNTRSRGLLCALTPHQESPPSDAWIQITERDPITTERTL